MFCNVDYRVFFLLIPGIIRRRNSKDRQYNDQMKNYKQHTMFDKILDRKLDLTT